MRIKNVLCILLNYKCGEPIKPHKCNKKCRGQKTSNKLYQTFSIDQKTTDDGECNQLNPTNANARNTENKTHQI